MARIRTTKKVEAIPEPSLRGGGSRRGNLLARPEKETFKLNRYSEIRFVFEPISRQLRKRDDMIVFEVSLNGNVLTRAGAEDLGVLTAILTATGELGPKSHWPNDTNIESHRFVLQVGGRTKRESGDDVHHVWLHESELRPNDVITVKVLEQDEADEHTT